MSKKMFLSRSHNKNFITRPQQGDNGLAPKTFFFNIYKEGLAISYLLFIFDIKNMWLTIHIRGTIFFYLQLRTEETFIYIIEAKLTIKQILSKLSIYFRNKLWNERPSQQIYFILDISKTRDILRSNIETKMLRKMLLSIYHHTSFIKRTSVPSTFFIKYLKNG